VSVGSFLPRKLWGEGARLWILLAFAMLLAVSGLGARELWTHEQRWALICLEMMRSGDYLHPVLLDQPYYDKPLGSYWLMIALAPIFGGLTEWALRLPSALAAVVAVWATSRLAAKRFGPRAGLLAGWMLASTFLFQFWARVASSDMLNLAGTIGAVAWYFERRESPGLVTYSVFGLICGATALMKGLIGPALALLVLLPDLAANGEWKRHRRWTLPVGALPGLALYAAPFLLAGASATGPTLESGFWMVIRENVVRYFAPFDHQDPFYIYFGWLPLVTLPWAIFLPWAIARSLRAWRTLSPEARWCAWAVGLIFLFLTVSGSRRSYYILPIAPFATLYVAEWLVSAGWESRRQVAAGWMATAGGLGCAAVFWVGAPVLDNAATFAELGREVRAATAGRGTVDEAVLVDAPMKTIYYVAPAAKAYRRNITAGEDPRRRIDSAGVERLRAFLADHPRAILFAPAEIAPVVAPLVPGRIQLRHRLADPPVRGLQIAEKPGAEIVAFLPAR